MMQQVIGESELKLVSNYVQSSWGNLSLNLFSMMHQFGENSVSFNLTNLARNLK